MFYAIAGENGVAVMDSLKGAEKLKKYIRTATIQDFRQFENAESWALATFRRCSPLGDRLKYLQLNHAIFNRDIISGLGSLKKRRP